VAEEVESASHEMEIELSPLVEEIAISSVTQLHKIGVKFRPTEGGLGIWDLLFQQEFCYILPSGCSFG
jgi:hypothetical protein